MAEMCRNKLRDVIFHVFLHAIRRLRKLLVAQFVFHLMISTRSLGLACLTTHAAISSSSAPVDTISLNCSDEIPVKLKNMLSSGQSKWYSPIELLRNARHLSSVRAAMI